MQVFGGVGVGQTESLHRDVPVVHSGQLFKLADVSMACQKPWILERLGVKLCSQVMTENR